MAAESLVEKLTRTLQDAQETLRAQFAAKVAQVAQRAGPSLPSAVRQELDLLADDLIAQFAAAYQEMITAVEEGLPAGAPARKATTPRKKSPPKDPAKDPVFVRPTYVRQAFSAEGLRVAKAARPALMEVLNDAIREDIARIKQQLPTITRGEHEGEVRRVTIQPVDVERAKTAMKAAPPPLAPNFADAGQDLDTIPLGVDAPGHELAVVLRLKKE